MIAYDHDCVSAIFDSSNNTKDLKVHVPDNIRHVIVELYADLKDEYYELDDFEVDLFACFLDSSGKVPSNDYLMYYNNEYLWKSEPGEQYFVDRRWIWGFPDALAEAYYLHLDIVPKEIESIVFFCDIYDAESRNYDYDMCNYVRMRIGNSKMENSEGMSDGEIERKATLAQWEVHNNLRNATVVNFATLRRAENGWDIVQNEGIVQSNIKPELFTKGTCSP